MLQEIAFNFENNLEKNIAEYTKQEHIYRIKNIALERKVDLILENWLNETKVEEKWNNLQAEYNKLCLEEKDNNVAIINIEKQFEDLSNIYSEKRNEVYQSENIINNYKELQEIECNLYLFKNELVNQTITLNKNLNKDSNLLEDKNGKKILEIIAEQKNSVVNIQNDYGSGSGFILNDDGYILSNKHVITNFESNNKVQLIDARYEIKEIPAEVIGIHPFYDLAIIKINPELLKLHEHCNLKPVIFETQFPSSGSLAIAMGNSNGLEWEKEDTNITFGTIINVERTEPLDFSCKFIESILAISPGNSGGPLFNAQGQVIGINTIGYWEEEIIYTDNEPIIAVYPTFADSIPAHIACKAIYDIEEIAGVEINYQINSELSFFDKLWNWI